MRLLIDGYNVMHAAGAMAPRFGPGGLQQARERFLNRLAEGLGPVESALATVVFDASKAPGDAPSESTHKGLKILFAVDEPSADDLIEHLIAAHARPKTLTVVSTDLRLRRAAARRKARAQTADAFLGEISARRRPPPRPPSSAANEPRPAVDAAEARYWMEQFGDLEADPEVRDALRGHSELLTDEEIARIQREIDAEEP